MKHTRGIIFYLLLLISPGLFAQQKPVAEVSVEKNRVLLGEPFRLRLQVQYPAGSAIPFPVMDSIPHFEFTQGPEIDSSNENGARNIKAIYHLTSFDSGHWIIPSFQIAKGIRTDTIGVDVTFADFNPEQPYHDIKDIIEVKPEKKKPWWYAACGALLIILLVIYLLRRKKPVAASKPVSRIDPYQEAIQKLEELQRTKPDHKQFYSKLTDIFRLYLFRKKGILSLQKTTEDLVIQLKDIGLPKEDFEKLSRSLRLSDFVKFAKYNPAEEDNITAYNDILNTIKTIEQSGSISPFPGGS